MESNPDSAQLMVWQIFRLAGDHNQQNVQKATAQLAEWELQPGFFAHVARLGVGASTVADPLDSKTRWMAILYLKNNAVNKFWRRSALNEVAAEEKREIRDLLLRHYATEPAPQIARQIAVTVGRIARHDCPREWPELMPELMQRLQEVAQVGVANVTPDHQRVLLTLHYVIKELASRRMMADKRVFEELAGNIFGFIWQLWSALTTLFFEQLKADSGGALVTLERAHLTMRTLRKLATFGFAKPQNSEQCLCFVKQLFLSLRQCLECRLELMRLGAEERMVTQIQKFILKQLKTLAEFHELHKVAFARFVPMALEFTFDHVFHEGTRLIYTDNELNFRNFALHCINMMKNIMLSATLDPPTEPEGSSPLAEFFTTERICYICEKLILNYFPLTHCELEMWAEDAENFMLDECGDSWKYDLRPAIDSFYMACFSEYRGEMTAQVIKYIQRAQESQLTTAASLKDILMKDAIYNAAGQAAFHFFNEVDFDDWFSKHLVVEVGIETDHFRILRRRIIWLVGEWAGIKFARKLRPLAYEVCLHLLRPTEDMFVRLSAARTLSSLIGEFEFEPAAFLKYLEPSFNALHVLLHEAKECDTKMNVLSIMSLLVEKMGDHIEPQADNLISYLPLLWHESEEHNMLRCSIVCTLQQIVKVVHDIPAKLKPFLYSVLELGTNVKDPAHIYLMEEALSLWLVVVENSTCVSPPLLDLCKHLMPILEMSTEHMRPVFTIIQAYVILNATAFLERYGRNFFDYCARSMPELRSEGVVLMMRLYETCLKSDANYCMDLLRPTLPYIFKRVYQDDAFVNILSMFLMIVSRVLLFSQSVFMEVLQELQLPNPLEKIFDVWLERMPAVTEIEKRKLFGLALCSVFSNNPIILERFPAIMQNLASVLQEVMQTGYDQDEPTEGAAKAATKYLDALVFQDENDLELSSYCSVDEFDYKTFHYNRCRILSLKDPVHKISLNDYVDWQLKSLCTELGEQPFQDLLNHTNPSTLEVMQPYLKIVLQHK